MKRDFLQVIIKIRMVGIGNNNHVFVITAQETKSSLAKIQRMGLITVNNQYSIPNLTGTTQ